MWLTYPALGLALISAAPSILDRASAIFQNQTRQQHLYAEQQKKFWEENGVCVDSFYNPEEFADDSGNVSALLCPSRDIAVVFIDKTTRLPVYAGIEMDFLRNKVPFKETASNEIFGMAAYAASPSGLENHPQLQGPDGPAGINMAQGAQVICQQMQADGRTLLRHINNGAGACFDESVDTFTGMVTSVLQVPCRQTCD